MARSEYVKWLFNLRMVMVLTILIPTREMIIIPMSRAAQEMGQPLNAFETCIAAANSGVVLLLLPLIYLVLTASFPTADENMLFYIVRMGRKNWILWEMLFQLMSVLSYCLMVVVLIVVQTAGTSFWANGWSIAVTDFDKMDYALTGFHMGTLLPPNLFYQMPPYKALFLSYFLLALFLLFCSMAFLWGCLCGRKLLAFFLVIAQIVLGCGMCEVKHVLMWIFPFCHSVLTVHYQKYFRKYAFPPNISVLLFLSVLTILAVLCYRKAKKVNLDMIGGDVFL